MFVDIRDKIYKYFYADEFIYINEFYHELCRIIHEYEYIVTSRSKNLEYLNSWSEFILVSKINVFDIAKIKYNKVTVNVGIQISKIRQNLVDTNNINILFQLVYIKRPPTDYKKLVF